MTAILFAFVSAAFLGAGVVTTQFGLRTVEPLSGTAISVPTFTIVFMLLSPLLLWGEPIIWRAVPIFAGVGLFFPAMLTILTFASNGALGPVVTSALGNFAPLFSVIGAVLILGEPLRPAETAGLVVAVLGAVVTSVSRPRELGHWRTWALLLPLTGAVLRGVAPPVVKLGLEIWPSPVAAGLIGYMVSSIVLLIVQRARTGHFIVNAPWQGRLWFAVTGMCNGLAALTLYAAVKNGPITTVAPLLATYPLVTVALSALVLSHVRITPRLVAGTLLTVGGVVLVLLG